MHQNSLLGAAVCTLALMGMSVGPALAKPDDVPRGQVERGPEHANSICAFSGLNDTPDADFPEDGQVQSYGQLIKRPEFDPAFFKAMELHPGMACNGHLVPWQDVSGGGGH